MINNCLSNEGNLCSNYSILKSTFRCLKQLRSYGLTSMAPLRLSFYLVSMCSPLVCLKIITIQGIESSHILPRPGLVHAMAIIFSGVKVLERKVFTSIITTSHF